MGLDIWDLVLYYGDNNTVYCFVNRNLQRSSTILPQLVNSNMCKLLRNFILALLLILPILAVGQAWESGGIPKSSLWDLVNNNDSVGLASNSAFHPLSKGAISKQNRPLSDEIELTYTNSTLWNNVTDMIVEEGLAYLVMINGLQILDVSDPENPTFASQTNLVGKRSLSLAKEGNDLYIGILDSGIYKYDVSDPFSPKLLGRYVTHCSARSLTVQNDLAYIGCGMQIEIVDFSNSNSPVLLGTFPIPGDQGYIARDIAIVGNYAYVAAGNIWIIDISDPSNPSEIVRYQTNNYRNYARGLVVKDTLIYIADADAISPSYKSRLTIINISNPSAPEAVANVSFYGSAGYIEVSENFAYISAGKGGLVIYNISFPNNPTMIGCYPTPGHASALEMVGDYIYLSDNIDVWSEETSLPNCDTQPSTALPGDFQILDVSDNSNPALKGSYRTSGPITKIITSKDLAYVTFGEGAGGGAIIDISKPDALEIVSYFETSGYPENLVLSDNYLFILDYFNDLQIIDLTDIKNPTLVGSCDTPNYSSGLAIKGSYAYVSNPYYGLLAFDVSNPTLPSYTVHCHTPGAAWDVAIHGIRAFIADGSSMQVVDISMPDNPVVVNSFTPNIEPIGRYIYIDIKGNRAYLYSQNGRVEIIDIKNPLSPSLMGHVDGLGGSYCLTVADNNAFLAMTDGGIYAVNISNPIDPYLAGHYNTNGFAFDVASENSLVYVADFFSLLQLSISNATDINEDDDLIKILPTTSQLGNNFPNPFNASTTIKYSIKSRTNVQIVIFNLLGQKIRTLFDGIQQTGIYTTNWDGTDDTNQPVASGIYFYQLKADDICQSKKMILLK